MPKTIQKHSVKVSEIPRSLYQAIVRIQASDDSDFDEACEKAAVLIDQNSKVFQQKVDSAANLLYKKRYMTEMNKARQTISKQVEQTAFNQGYRKGCEEGLVANNEAEFNRGIRMTSPVAWENGYKEGAFRSKFTCKKCFRLGTPTDMMLSNSQLSHYPDCERALAFETAAVDLLKERATGEQYDKIRSEVSSIMNIRLTNSPKDEKTEQT